MTVQGFGQSALDYVPCHYGASRLRFRGPQKPVDDAYVAFLGGAETFGRFVPVPFPALVEERLGTVCVNLGVCHAGADLHSRDGDVMRLAQGAAICVVQVLALHRMDNGYYSVHPRRNDRFLRAAPRLSALFPDVDFAQFHFTGHMLSALAETCPDRYQAVLQELRSVWVSRMTNLVAALPTPPILLQFGAEGAFGDGAAQVTRQMMDTLRPKVRAILSVAPSRAAQQEGTRGMVFDPFEQSAAEGMPGPLAHHEAADALAAVLSGHVPQ